MRKAKGFSLIELLLVVAIMLILAAIAIPAYLRARISANEASAVSSVRTITNAQVIYKISHVGYASDMSLLGPANADLIDPLLGSSPYRKSGYSFSTVGDSSTFAVYATPVSAGSSGVRTFCTSTTAYIQFQPDGSACDPNDPATPVLQ